MLKSRWLHAFNAKQTQFICFQESLGVIFSFSVWYHEKSQHKTALVESLMGQLGFSPKNGRLTFGDELRFPTSDSFRRSCCIHELAGKSHNPGLQKCRLNKTRERFVSEDPTACMNECMNVKKKWS